MVDIEQLAEDGKLFDGRYKLLRTLSTDGGTADVWLAMDVNTIDNPALMGEDSDSVPAEESGMLVAIKIYRPKNALDIEGEQRFRDEYKIVHNCRHTNLLQPTNFSICGDTPYLELPYCKNGSSEKLIGKPMSDKEAWKFIFDVSSGLSYLHACNPKIIHQDIKPANVLIDDRNNYAITDFGISSQSGGKHGYYYDEDNSGTMAYMAPERFGENYIPTAESDIWAFGATLYEILTGDVPFGEEGGKNQLKKNVKMKPMGRKVSKDIQKLIVACMSVDPKKRPTANEIIKISGSHLSSSKGIVKFLAVVAVLAGAAWGISGFIVKKPVVVPIEESYKKAMTMLNCENDDSIRAGVAMMDSLAKHNYVPAMYEMARTYGWYTDSLIMKRQAILGIKYEYDSIGGFLPDRESDRAMSYFQHILELKDRTYDSINADAAYRMAAFYGNTGGSEEQIKEYLLEAQEYTETAISDSIKCDSLLSRIKRSEEKVDERKKEDKMKVEIN